MIDVLKWAPTGSFAWLSARDRSPGMVNLRQNGAYMHEVAKNLIEDKRQELKNGTSRRDILSLLGLSRLPFTKLDIPCDIRFFSQDGLITATGFENER